MRKNSPGARAFLGYMMAHPGKKLLFMGCEFGQFKEWDYESGAGLAAAGLRIAHRMLQHFVAYPQPFLPGERRRCGKTIFPGTASPGLRTTIMPKASLPSAASITKGEELVALCNFTPVRAGALPHRACRSTAPMTRCSPPTRREFGGGGILERARWIREQEPDARLGAVPVADAAAAVRDFSQG